jgi:(S)-ureidoglycine aminohydrolase
MSDSTGQDPFGQTRTVVKERYALITPDGFVPSSIPGWEESECNILISPRLGANLNQWLATMPAGSTGPVHTEGCSVFLYVLAGKVAIEKQELDAGAYAYLPPRTDLNIGSKANGSQVLFFEKRYAPIDGYHTPEIIFGNQAQVPGEPFLGNEDARLQTLLPDTPHFDMAVNIFVYDPGATLPFVETHIMEHGLMMLKGQGVYRLGADYHPVASGDVIWMSPWCPQWYVSMGRETSSYIYYKDINRQPAL